MHTSMYVYVLYVDFNGILDVDTDIAEIMIDGHARQTRSWMESGL